MRKFIGTWDFYKLVLVIAIPIIIQTGITNFVSLLDNIMIGQVGTDQMSGVAIANQLILVFNITIFGAISGPGIFGAQFFGAGDHKGHMHTFRFKMVSCTVITLLAIFIIVNYGTELISLFLHEGSLEGNIEKTLLYSKKYIGIILFGLFPFAITNAYGSSLRETGETIIPMISSLVAVVINIILNFMLIFGNWGAPKLGVAGAAIATVVARYAECLVLIIWTHTHRSKYHYIEGAYNSIFVPRSLLKDMVIKGTPLLINEMMWSMGMAFLMQCYSVRGLDVVAAMNINTTISNVFNIIFLSMGNVVSIIVGQQLGANRMDEAKETAGKLIFLSVVISIISGGAMALCSSYFPAIYNTTDGIKELAAMFIIVAGCCMPLYAFLHSTYFTIRSGGKTIITFLFDSVFVWVVSIPFAYIMTRFTPINIVLIYLMCQLLEIIKCIIGYVLVKRGVWLNNIVEI